MNLVAVLVVWCILAAAPEAIAADGAPAAPKANFAKGQAPAEQPLSKGAAAANQKKRTRKHKPKRKPKHRLVHRNDKVLMRRTSGPTGKRGGARSKQLSLATGHRYVPTEQPWLQWRHATGHWWGARTWLEGHGLVVEPGYSAEVASVLGGKSKGKSSFDGLFDLLLALKGEPTIFGETKLVVIGQVAHGSGVTEGGIEDLQVISNIDCPDRTQLAEVWLRQDFLNRKWWLKVGKMDANVDFAALELAAELLHSSFGVPPNIPLPTFPDPGVGATVAFEPSKIWRFELGVYEGSPDGERVLPNRETFGHGWVGLAEATVHTAPLFGRGVGGSIHLGGWVKEPGDKDLASRTAGGWLMFEEPFWTQDDRFAAVFGQFSLRRGDHGVFGTYVGGGVLSQGLLASRPHDVLSLAFAIAQLFRGAETAIELQYKVSLTTAINLAADVQYIDNPGGHVGSAIAGLARLTTQL